MTATHDGNIPFHDNDLVLLGRKDVVVQRVGFVSLYILG